MANIRFTKNTLKYMGRIKETPDMSEVGRQDESIDSNQLAKDFLDSYTDIYRAVNSSDITQLNLDFYNDSADFINSVDEDVPVEIKSKGAKLKDFLKKLNDLITEYGAQGLTPEKDAEFAEALALLDKWADIIENYQNIMAYLPKLRAAVDEYIAMMAKVTGQG